MRGAQRPALPYMPRTFNAVVMHFNDDGSYDRSEVLCRVTADRINAVINDLRISAVQDAVVMLDSNAMLPVLIRKALQPRLAPTQYVQLELDL